MAGGASIYSAEFALITRLAELGLFGRRHRKAFVEAVADDATMKPSDDFLTAPAFTRLLTVRERSYILGRIRREVIPHVDRYVSDWESNYDTSDDPSVYFDGLVDAFRTFEREFEYDSDVSWEIEKARDRVRDLVRDFESDRASRERESDTTDDSSETIATKEDLSVFDDVDT